MTGELAKKLSQHRPRAPNPPMFQIKPFIEVATHYFKSVFMESETGIVTPLEPFLGLELHMGGYYPSNMAHC